MVLQIPMGLLSHYLLLYDTDVSYSFRIAMKERAVAKKRYGMSGGGLLLLFTIAATACLLAGMCLKVDVPPLTKADAIYVLAGEFLAKNPEAVRLYLAGYAPKIIIYNDAIFSSWSPERVRNLFQVEWAEEDLVKRGVPRSAIIRLPFAGNGTRYEALALRRYLALHRMSKIILVTEEFHARRTAMTFRHLLEGITEPITVAVVFPMTRLHSMPLYVKEAVKTLYYTCWFYGCFPFMSSEEINGSTAISRSSLPLTVFRKTEPLVVKTTEMKIATTGVPYAVGIAIRGGVGPYTMILEEGTLPTGILLNDRFTFYGTPLQIGRYPVTVKVTDGADYSISRRYLLDVKPGPLTLKTKAVPDGRVGKGYAFALQVTGGGIPCEWSSSDLLPPGLSLHPNGLINGVPTMPGTYPVSATVRDSCGVTLTGHFNFTIVSLSR